MQITSSPFDLLGNQGESTPLYVCFADMRLRAILSLIEKTPPPPQAPGMLCWRERQQALGIER